ncbi:hypothetical protein C2G38_2148714 [Gigaspora rosea]|uniref:Amino acid transporter transmembrane domain-containing protein n=1 Tax=Gigaspora rosea TaxID=44941 RepID=A0A397UCK4_9GLOM|nr:hypothetical protein C2G38_2148714 [Gigaspora rosea]
MAEILFTFVRINENMRDTMITFWFKFYKMVTVCEGSIFVMSDQYDNIEIQEDKRLKSKSTLVQSISNFCNALIGVGILSLPLAFKYKDGLSGYHYYFSAWELRITLQDY